MVVRFLMLNFITTFLFSCHNGHKQQTIVPDTTAIEPDIILEYGLPADSFQVVRGRVRPNETLSDILRKNKAGAIQINQLVRNKNKEWITIKPGQPYSVFLSRDTNQFLQCFAIEQSPVSYTLFDFRDSLRVNVIKKEVRTQQMIRSGVIKTSLWDAVKENEVNPAVALELSEIFAWTVDFFALQKNDSFKVVYDELFVDNKSAGISEVKGAVFYWEGQAYYAVIFEQDGIKQYFDENGNSLRREFLKAPLRFKRISSKFSHRRKHPVLRVLRPHYGVDYAADAGTPVYATANGVVIETGHKVGEGNYVKIRHNSVYTTGYLHLQQFARGIKKGQSVTQSQVIGYVGNTGLSTGPHLDYRVWKNGSPVNPLKMESKPVEPVDEKNRGNYTKYKKNILSLLNEHLNVHH